MVIKRITLKLIYVCSEKGYLQTINRLTAYLSYFTPCILMDCPIHCDTL